MRAISALGESALILPAWLLLLGALLVTRRAKEAFVWFAATVLCGSSTLAAKLLFHACGPGISTLDVVSPSGHASLACIFYGGLAIMVGIGRPVWFRVIAATGCIALLALIAASRVALGVHTAEEVVLGLLIGAACLAAFAAAYGRVAPSPLPVLPLTAGFLVALVLLGGRHLSLEPLIGRAARRIAATADLCSNPAIEQQVRLGRRPTSLAGR